MRCPTAGMAIHNSHYIVPPFFVAMYKRFYILAGCLISVFSLGAQSSLVQVTDLLKIKRLADVAVSADGSKAIFTVTGSVADEKLKWEYPYQTQLWMVKLDGKSAPLQLTTAKEGATQPALSPDGSMVAFV
jgi:Tol biopolymer transport system component